MVDGRNRFWTLLCVAFAATVLGGCGDAGGDAEQAEQPRSTANATQGEGSGGSGYTVDIDAIFPPGPGKDLVLNNCQNCHTWVPIVVLQMNEQEWDR